MGTPRRCGARLRRSHRRANMEHTASSSSFFRLTEILDELEGGIQPFASPASSMSLANECLDRLERARQQCSAAKKMLKMVEKEARVSLALHRSSQVLLQDARTCHDKLTVSSQFSRWQRRVKYKRNRRSKTANKQEDVESADENRDRPEMGSKSMPPMPKPIVAPDVSTQQTSAQNTSSV